jgi:hypothetical protein
LKLDETELTAAVDAGIITREQADRLWQFWQGGEEAEFQGDDGSSPLSKFLYYLGALIVIGAMGWLMNATWDSFQGAGLFFIAAAYAAAFCIAAWHFRAKSPLLSGLLVVMAVCMTPLGVFGLQKWFSLWPFANPGHYRNFFHYMAGGWFTMELATLLAGCLALRFSRIPFATAPLAVVLWFMSIDVAALLSAGPGWVVREKVSAVFGLGMLLLAVAIDRRTRVDYAKWLYIFGLLAFWGGVTLLDAGTELGRLLYCLLNVVLMFAGILLDRKAFIVFGGLGFFGYLGHLSWTVFRGSMLFPAALTALGLSVVYSGWLYHRKQADIVKAIYYFTPQAIIDLLPQNKRKK